MSVRYFISQRFITEQDFQYFIYRFVLQIDGYFLIQVYLIQFIHEGKL